jgi:CTD kinase subunit beta
MLDAARARHERTEFDKYHKIEEEEYEVEVPNVPTGPEPDRRNRVR